MLNNESYRDLLISILYFVEKKNMLNNESYRDLLISILLYDEVSAFLLWVKARN